MHIYLLVSHNPESNHSCELLGLIFHYAFSIKTVDGQNSTSWILTRALISWNLKARWKQWNTRSADLVEPTHVGKFSGQACMTMFVVSCLTQFIDITYIVCLVPQSDISVVENKNGCVCTRLSRINDIRCTREIKSRNGMSKKR